MSTTSRHSFQNIFICHINHLYAPYENKSWLVLDLMNEATTAYACAVLSSGVTMALDGTEVLCYLVKNVGVPMEAILYDFQIEELMETMSRNILSYPTPFLAMDGAGELKYETNNGMKWTAG